MDGNGLRERRPKEPNKEHKDDTKSHSEEMKSEKTRGRTPDGTGESVISCFNYGRVKLFHGFVTGKASQGEG